MNSTVFFKNFPLFLLLIFLSCFNSFSQERSFVNVEWEMANGDPTVSEIVASSVDPNGNLVYISNDENGNNSDIILNCVYPNGTIAWEHNCSSSQTLNDYGTDLKIDAQGNIYICAARSSATDLDFYVAKYAQNGSLIWESTINGQNNLDDIPVALEIDAFGNVYVTGHSFNSSGVSDYLTVKLDQNGSLEWDSYYDYNGLNEKAVDVVLDNAGHVVVCGMSGADINNTDIAVLKYNKNSGNQMQSYRHDSPDQGHDVVNQMVTNNNGKLFLTGSIDNNGDHDLLVLRLNNNLGLGWIQTIDKSGNFDEGTSLDIDATSNFIAVTGSLQKNSGGSNMVTTLLLANNGTILWRQEKTAEIDDDPCNGRSVICAANGSIYASGEVTKDGKSIYTITSFSLEGRVKWSRDLSNNDSDGRKGRTMSESNGKIYISGVRDGSTKKVSTVKISEMNIVQSPVACDETGNPCYVDDIILVRFNPQDLVQPNADNTRITWGIVADFVQGQAINDINSIMGYDIGKLRCYKVYPNFTSTVTSFTTRFDNLIKLPPFYATYAIELPIGSDEQASINTLNTAVPHILRTSVNGYIEYDAVADDPFYTTQYASHLHWTTQFPYASINVDRAWDYETGRSDVLVGIYDSGINNLHEDLGLGSFSSSSVAGGFDYYNNAPITTTTHPDNHGHGSAIGGLIGAWRNNQIGTSGVAGGPDGNGGVSFNDMKTSHVESDTCFLFGSTYDVIMNAMMEGALGIGPIVNPDYVQNHSWGAGLTTANGISLLLEALITVYDSEVIFCYSSGNGNFGGGNCNAQQWPNNWEDHWIIQVGANDGTGARAPFSNCPSNLDFIAPGHQDLYVFLAPLVNDQYNFVFEYPITVPPFECFAFQRGTSFAAPHAAGVAALLWSYFLNTPGLQNPFSQEDCEYLMERFATDIDQAPNSPGPDQETGCGRLNAGNVFDNAWYPKYLINHHSFDVSTSTATLVGSGEYTCIQESMFGIPAGSTVKVDRYAVTGTNTHAQPPGYILLDSWARGSGSVNAPGATITTTNINLAQCDNPNTGRHFPSENNPTLNSFDESSATMTAYTYAILDGFNNVLGWWPVDLNSTMTFAYTLYWEDPLIVGTPEIVEDNFSIYPNPTNSSCIIDLGNYKSEWSEIYLMDVTGKFVMQIANSDNFSGENLVSFNVESIAAGLYYVAIRNEQKQIVNKLIVQ